MESIPGPHKRLKIRALFWLFNLRDLRPTTGPARGGGECSLGKEGFERERGLGDGRGLEKGETEGLEEDGKEGLNGGGGGRGK